MDPKTNHELYLFKSKTTFLRIKKKPFNIL